TPGRTPCPPPGPQGRSTATPPTGGPAATAPPPEPAPAAAGPVTPVQPAARSPPAGPSPAAGPGPATASPCRAKAHSEAACGTGASLAAGGRPIASCRANPRFEALGPRGGPPRPPRRAQAPPRQRQPQ